MATKVTASGVRKLRLGIQNSHADVINAYNRVQRTLSLLSVAEAIMAELDKLSRKPRKFVFEFYDSPEDHLHAPFGLYKVSERDGSLVVGKEFASSSVPLGVWHSMDYNDVGETFGVVNDQSLAILETKKITRFITQLSKESGVGLGT